MSLSDIPFDKITEGDIRILCEASVGESAYLDFKEQTYGADEKSHAEFLADISSFANTFGGDLVIGVKDTAGVAASITPFKGDIDKEKQRLEQMALHCLEPRIPNLRIREIPFSAGGHVIAIRVPRSFILPHRVIYKNKNRFWARAGVTKYEPNVEQLRRMFTDGPDLADRVRSFRSDRIARINAGETPIPLNKVAKAVVHVVPLPAFVDGRLFDVVSAVATGTHIPLPLDSLGGGNRPGINLDGFFNYRDRANGRRQSYALLFRSGAIEGVRELSSREDGCPYFVGPEFLNDIVAGVRQYLGVLKSYDTGLPVYIFLSMLGTENCFYRYSPEGLGWVDTAPLGRNPILFQEIQVESFDVDVPQLMRPTFNILWNAFGFERCDMYDGQGAWKGH